MMNLIFVIAIIVLNIVALGFVYKILKKLPKKDIVIFLAVSVAIIYLLVSFVYFLSGIGIDEKIHDTAKDTVIFLFVPINMIITIPYLAFQYNKVRERKIKYIDFSNKISIILAILVIALIAEFFYFKNIQNNIKTINEQVTKAVEENSATNTAISNNIVTNDITSEIINTNINEITNTVVNDINNTNTNAYSTTNNTINEINQNITNSIIEKTNVTNQI